MSGRGAGFRRVSGSGVWRAWRRMSVYGGVRACMAVYAPCTAVYGRACTVYAPCMAVYGRVRLCTCARVCAIVSLCWSWWGCHCRDFCAACCRLVDLEEAVESQRVAVESLRVDAGYEVPILIDAELPGADHSSCGVAEDMDDDPVSSSVRWMLPPADRLPRPFAAGLELRRRPGATKYFYKRRAPLADPLKTMLRP